LPSSSASSSSAHASPSSTIFHSILVKISPGPPFKGGRGWRCGIPVKSPKSLQRGLCSHRHPG
jgi:hypothetical protein